MEKWVFTAIRLTELIAVTAALLLAWPVLAACHWWRYK